MHAISFTLFNYLEKTADGKEHRITSNSHAADAVGAPKAGALLAAPPRAPKPKPVEAAGAEAVSVITV